MMRSFVKDRMEEHVGWVLSAGTLKINQHIVDCTRSQIRYIVFFIPVFSPVDYAVAFAAGH